MIVISGATGTVGGLLTRRLAAAGVPARAVSRKPDDADLPVPVVYADFSRPETVSAALAGADAMFLLHAGESPDGISALVSAIAASGVRRVVYLSALVAGTRPDSVIGAPHWATEELLSRQDLELTVLRPGQFASNTLWWRPMIQRGTVYAPFADVALPMIDPDDIAAVAELILTGPDSAHAGQVYPLTGPELITARERVRILADVLGRPIDFVELSAEQARAAQRQTMPAEVVDATLALIGSPTAAEREILPTVQELLGRSARDFATWAAANKSALG